MPRAWLQRRRSDGPNYPIRGVFKFPAAGLRDAVLRAIADPRQQDTATKSPITAVVRRWQREQPEQFAELAVLILEAPRRPVVRAVTRAA